MKCASLYTLVSHFYYAGANQSIVMLMCWNINPVWQMGINGRGRLRIGFISFKFKYLQKVIHLTYLRHLGVRWTALWSYLFLSSDCKKSGITRWDLTSQFPDTWHGTLESQVICVRPYGEPMAMLRIEHRCFWFQVNANHIVSFCRILQCKRRTKNNLYILEILIVMKSLLSAPQEDGYLVSKIVRVLCIGSDNILLVVMGSLKSDLSSLCWWKWASTRGNALYYCESQQVRGSMFSES